MAQKAFLLTPHNTHGCIASPVFLIDGQLYKSGGVNSYGQHGIRRNGRKEYYAADTRADGVDGLYFRVEA